MILRTLKNSDEIAFKKAIEDFRQNDPEWQFAFDFDESAPFATYVTLVNSWARGENVGRFVASTFFIAIVDETIVGRVSLRHELNDFLMWEEGGHIGYGVVPSHRRKGYATQMLRLALDRAKELKIPKALLTTDEWNIGSIKTIVKNGGVKETGRDPKIRSDKLRYWIEL